MALPGGRHPTWGGDAIELLREKQYEEWRADERRRDAAAMDEIAARMMLSRNPLTAAPDAGSTP